MSNCAWAIKCLFFSKSETPATEIRRGVTLVDAISECVRAKKVAGRRALYVTSLRQSLEQFEREHGKFLLIEVTPDVLEKWIARFENQYYRLLWRNRLSALFSFCVRRGYLAKNPCENLERLTITHATPVILTPGQVLNMMEFSRRKIPRFTAWLALAVFAGVRPQELARMKWSDVDLDNGRVTIGGAASKVHRRRVTPLSKNAVEWLRLGGDLPVPHTSKRRYVRQIRNHLALRSWPQDALRHTAATFMLTREQDAGKVSLWLGNSPKVLLTHYHQLSLPATADEFWNLYPADDQREFAFLQSGQSNGQKRPAVR